MDKDVYKELQEMLPDYVFDRLNISDRDYFEKNIINYPDLSEEIAQVKAVFNRFDKMNFDDKINHRARNLSVKVIEKRDRRKSYKYTGSQFLVRYLVPTAIIVTIGLYYLGSPKIDNSDFTRIIDKKVESLADSLQNVDVAEEILNFPQSVQIEEELSDNLENEYNEEISDMLSEVIDLSEINNGYLEADIYSTEKLLNKVQDLDENEFQEIYEEIKNVKLND